MSNKLSWSITCLALVAMGVMYWSQDKGYNEGDHVFRPVQPMTSHNQELQDRERVELSETTALRRDQMVTHRQQLLDPAQPARHDNVRG
jgi:hypothetical protein